MQNGIDFTREPLAADITRLREALADLERKPATEVGEHAHAYAVGRLIADVQILLADVDVATTPDAEL